MRAKRRMALALTLSQLLPPVHYVAARAAPPNEPAPRTARLLPPQPGQDAHDRMAPIARAQSEPLPPLGMTPVVRPTHASPLPAWLRGTAAGVTTNNAATHTAAGSPPPTTHANSAAMANTGQAYPVPTGSVVSAQLLTPPENAGNTVIIQPKTRLYTTYPGVSPNGQTVYAGPPAYRWYGYGAASPPPYLAAFHGQYPRASEEWYAITGATAGAFPLPIAASAAPAAPSLLSRPSPHGSPASRLPAIAGTPSWRVAPPPLPSTPQPSLPPPPAPAVAEPATLQPASTAWSSSAIQTADPPLRPLAITPAIPSATAVSPNAYPIVPPSPAPVSPRGTAAATPPHATPMPVTEPPLWQPVAPLAPREPLPLQPPLPSQSHRTPPADSRKTPAQA